MTRIRVLPDALINQIAAGEVVERPASVVKELVENALDAGARSLKIALDGGGSRRVRVDDDGCGMDPDDALLALERHATSKIAIPEDLARIGTLGFRGEALPSIAAASRLTIETAAEVAEGTRVEVDFGRIVSVAPCARPAGTTVVVEDLFSRLPARKKFLRSDATELRHVLATLTALAFARPGVGFVVEHNGKPILHLPPAPDFAKRLADLVGPQRSRQARPIAHATGVVTVSGYLLPAGGGRETVLLVNDRPVRDRLLITTLNRALRGPAGTPEADAFVTIHVPADTVDVNVHPAKAEVRFVDPGRVIGAVAAAVAGARALLHGPVDIRRIVTVPASASPSYGVAPPWATAGLPGSREPAPDRLLVGESSVAVGDGAYPSSGRAFGRFIGQYRGTYLLLEDEDGLLLVDQHAAHERVLFERLLATETTAPSQRLLVPDVVDLTPVQAGLVAEVGEELRSLGLEIEVVSGNTARVLALPAALPNASAARLVEQLLSDVSAGRAPGDTLRERLAASLSCRAAIKKNWPLSLAEADRLLTDLDVCAEKHRCPHGRPILIRLQHAEIERRIGRR